MFDATISVYKEFEGKDLVRKVKQSDSFISAGATLIARDCINDF